LLSGSNNYTTPSISTTTTYYAEARNISTGDLSTSRTAVAATVNTVPANPTGTDGARCDAGTVDISASSDGAVIDWYDQSTDGILLLSGNNDFSPSISVTTDYYAEARNATTGCVSALRTKVTATIGTMPTFSGAKRTKMRGYSYYIFGFCARRCNGFGMERQRVGYRHIKNYRYHRRHLPSPRSLIRNGKRYNLLQRLLSLHYRHDKQSCY